MHGETQKRHSEMPSCDRKEGGQSLVLFALGLGVLLGMVAMVSDVGMILYERRSLQNAADAAALAGAVELPESAVLADSKAKEWAENNGIDLATGDQISITVDAVTNVVKVEVTREASFIFGRVLGLTTVEVHASATARIGAPANLSGILPFGVLESAISYDGNPTTIKYVANNNFDGNFGPIRVDGNGSNVHENTIKYGSENAVCGLSQPSCVDPTVETQTGNLIGASRDGFYYRLDNTSSDCDEFDEVLIPIGSGRYNVKGSCNPWGGSSGSHRLVLVPVIDDFCTGHCTVTIQYFVAFFLNDLEQCTGNTCEVTGTFVKIVADPTYDADLGIYDEDSGVKFVRLVE